MNSNLETVSRQSSQYFDVILLFSTRRLDAVGTTEIPVIEVQISPDLKIEVFDNRTGNETKIRSRIEFYAWLSGLNENWPMFVIATPHLPQYVWEVFSSRRIIALSQEFEKEWPSTSEMARAAIRLRLLRWANEVAVVGSKMNASFLAELGYTAKLTRYDAIGSLIREASIKHPPVRRPNIQTKLDILILTFPEYNQIGMVSDHLEALSSYSKNNVHLRRGARFRNQEINEILLPSSIDFSGADVVVVNYLVRVCIENYGIAPIVKQALRQFSGFKVLFLQDEYDNVLATHEFIREAGVHLVFTTVPEHSIEKVYPKAALPGVVFVSILTGYVPLGAEEYENHIPIRDRDCLIAYRGRESRPINGELGREKIEIGRRMLEICKDRGLEVDIAWDEESRIYGAKYRSFLQKAKATLATESGSNVFDMDGSLLKRYKETIEKNPGLSYDEIRDQLFTEENLGVKMNQISPKFFEFIAAKTALVLFTGEYSGILEPGRHYIELKKDFSNVDDVLEKLADDASLQKMVDLTFDEIIASGTYSYQNFVEGFDSILSHFVAGRLNDEIFSLGSILPFSRSGNLDIDSLEACDALRISESELSNERSRRNEVEQDVIQLKKRISEYKKKIAGQRERIEGYKRRIVDLETALKKGKLKSRIGRFFAKRD